MKRSSGTARDYPRTARLNQLLQEIVAEEIERLDDERLGFFTVVGVEVEPDLRHAVVWYTALGSDDAERRRCRGGRGRPGGCARRAPRPAAGGRSAARPGIKRTPELSFRPDAVIRQAERVEEILRDLGDDDAT